MSFSEDCVRFGDRLRDLVETGVAVKDAAAALGMSGHRCYAILRATGHPIGAPRRRRGRVDRERIVVVFTATGSLQAAATASGISASAARRVLVAEGLVDEARRPRDKVAAKRRFLELVGSGWSARRAAREVGGNERTGRDWRDGIRKGRNTRIHPDGTVVDYTTGSRHISAVITTPRDVVRPISDRYLFLQNRLAIADGLLTGQTLTRIAAGIGKHPSTVSREIANRSINGSYLPYRADQCARPTGPGPSSPKGRPDLARRRSRRSVTAVLPDRSRTGFARTSRTTRYAVSHETIYQALYFQARGGLKREVAQSLRSGRPPQPAPFPRLAHPPVHRPDDHDQ